MIEIHIGKATGDGSSDFRDRGDELETEEQLCELAEILYKADRIKADPHLFRLVQQHMQRKQKKFTSIADLRNEAGKSDDERNASRHLGFGKASGSREGQSGDDSGVRKNPRFGSKTFPD